MFSSFFFFKLLNDLKNYEKSKRKKTTVESVLDVLITTYQPADFLNNDMPFDFPTIEFPTTTIVDLSVKNQHQSNDLKSTIQRPATNKSFNIIFENFKYLILFILNIVFIYYI
jgi:hypothetical protein